MLKFLTAVTLLFSLLYTGSASFAANGRWDDKDFVSTRIISAVDGVGDLSEIPLGLEFQLKPDWKIYWRTPGDAGLPPVPDWSASENVKDVEFRWPLPHRFSVLGLETLGYKTEVIFPLVVTPKVVGAPIHLKGNVSYLACSEICIPYNAIVDLKLDDGPANNAKQAHLINKFQAQVPSQVTAGELVIDGVQQQVIGGDFTLQLSIKSDRKIQNPDVYIEGADGLFFGAPSVKIDATGKMASLTLEGGGVPVEEFDGQPLTLTLYDDNGMMEVTRIPESGLLALEDSDVLLGASIFNFILLALLGGVILNLMPCVLPVLSIKLLSVVSHGGGEKRDVRIGFLATSAGIIVAFLILALVLLSLKAGGVAIGWGIQFQQPIFLIIMVMLLTFFAANMFGLFEFHLPGAVSNIAANAGPQKGLMGHFASGVFATLLATPCSAPFLGTAVGFALSRGAFEILTIFAALGVGLSAPYLLVALIPSLATCLPKPGQWMVNLRYVLGVAILATVAWLITVLITLLGLENALIIAAFSALIITVFWAKSLPHSRIGKQATKAALIIVIAAIAVPIFKPVGEDSLTVALRDETWVEFDEARIQNYIADGKTVFVDVTADWCITCKFNKKTVMETTDIAAWLSSPNVVAMRADWTKPNPIIAKYLASYGRYGIPFNIVYGPNDRQGIPLPELLSVDDIVDASIKASENNQVVSN